jgi:hypothetical protein
MLRFSLANALSLLGRNEDALAQFKKATELDKKEAKYLVEYGRQLLVRARTAGAYSGIGFRSAPSLSCRLRFLSFFFSVCVSPSLSLSLSSIFL